MQSKRQHQNRHVPFKLMISRMVSVGWLKFRKLRRGERDPTTNAGLGFRGQRSTSRCLSFGTMTTTEESRGRGRGRVREPEGDEYHVPRMGEMRSREKEQKQKCCGGGRLCSFPFSFCAGGSLLICWVASGPVIGPRSPVSPPVEVGHVITSKLTTVCLYSVHGEYL